jgi:lipopolysaccharide transport system ATP-binding protein
MIRIQNLGKEYRGFISIRDRILAVLSLGIYGGSQKHRALESLSFDVHSGEVLGIIGRNGAGKSTLLKILSGVSGYDSGVIQIKGKVRSILELGVGFNPELTGEQNVYYNALAIGYSESEIFSVMEEVFRFAGLTEYRNQPLKNYSSGMIMRLGFSLATANRPDVLLVDEALSVGDASFQQICIKRIQSFIQEGTSVLVVSHDLHLMSAICHKILVLDKGKNFFLGNPTEAIRKYMELIAGSNSLTGRSQIDTFQWDFTFGSKQQIKQTHFYIGELVELRVKVCFPVDLDHVTVGFHIEDHRGIRVFGTNSYLLKSNQKIIKEKSYSCIFQFPLNIREGKYSLSLAIHEGENHTEKCFLWKEGFWDFEVDRIDKFKFEGIAFLPTESRWEEDTQ